MTEKEIKKGFELLGLGYIKKDPYPGAEQYAKNFEIASALKDIRICVGNSVADCNQSSK